jgi:membrane fusion protein (multidrug efflux system)
MNATNITRTATQGLAVDTVQPARAGLTMLKVSAPEADEARTDGEVLIQHAEQVRKRRTFKRLAAICGALLGTALIAYASYRWWQHSIAWVGTDNAYVEGRIHQISARVAGTVLHVLADENQTVAAGTAIARLDKTDFELKRQQATAQLAQAQAQLKQAAAQDAQARAQVSRERSRMAKAEHDLNRASSLYHGSGGAISKQEFEDAQTTCDVANATVAAADSTHEAAVALGAAAQAQVEVAETNLRDAEQQLSYTEIPAPATGRIGKRNIETGNRVQPGQALFALVEPESWIVANFKETQLARIKPGQTAEVRLDAFPGRTFAGRVDSVAPASGAQFALLPPDNATGNFTRIVQRVPVKIVLEAASVGDLKDGIVPGMSGIVEIKVRE